MNASAPTVEAFADATADRPDAARRKLGGGPPEAAAREAAVARFDDRRLLARFQIVMRDGLV